MSWETAGPRLASGPQSFHAANKRLPHHLSDIFHAAINGLAASARAAGAAWRLRLGESRPNTSLTSRKIAQLSDGYFYQAVNAF